MLPGERTKSSSSLIITEYCMLGNVYYFQKIRCPIGSTLMDDWYHVGQVLATGIPANQQVPEGVG